MIPQKDLEKTTGYIHGANNPVGIRQKHNYPIFIDRIALDLEQNDCLCRRGRSQHYRRTTRLG